MSFHQLTLIFEGTDTHATKADRILFLKFNANISLTSVTSDGGPP